MSQVGLNSVPVHPRSLELLTQTCLDFSYKIRGLTSFKSSSSCSSGKRYEGNKDLKKKTLCASRLELTPLHLYQYTILPQFTPQILFRELVRFSTHAIFFFIAQLNVSFTAL